jgi:hypothetical protein
MLEKLRKHLVHDEAGLNPGWEGLRKLMNEN